jgi:lipoteichoic acid synthase
MRAAGLLGVFLIAKAVAIDWRDLAWSPWTPVAFLWQDVLVAGLFLIFERLAPSRWGWALYGVLATLAAMNVPVMRVVATPVTWPMLRGARPALADSLLHYLTWHNALAVAAAAAAAALLPRAARRLKPRTILMCAAACLPVVALGPAATARIDTAGLYRNPAVALVRSALPRVGARAGEADWRRSAFEGAAREDLSRFRGVAAGRNVVLVSLESTAAQYLQPWGDREDRMPNLTRLARRAILFENAYAVYPESIKGLFSLLCSVYPAFDTRADELARAPCESLASLVGRAGYRTAMFHSGRFGYLGMNAVIRDRGLHELLDAGDIGGNHNSSFGVDEPSTVARILQWVDGLPPGQRFFAAYLPVAGHHPYETPERGPYPDRDEFGRYSNALRYGDESIGALARGLRDRGLEEQTLWIVFGDHGEAFGQHPGNFGHTFFLYDENIRVPFLVAAPGRIEEEIRVSRVVSLVDTAPTVLDLLGLPSPRGYMGSSMLDPQPRMALFFTDYSLGLWGLRDGRWKFLHEVESGRSKLFDLAADAGERHDVSAAHAQRVEWYRGRLRAWAGAQREFILRPRPRRAGG